MAAKGNEHSGDIQAAFEAYGRTSTFGSASKAKLAKMVGARADDARGDADATKGLSIAQICKALNANGYPLQPDKARSSTYVGEERDGSEYRFKFKDYDHTGHVYVFPSGNGLKASLLT
jgi:hypothetical protein